MEKYYIGYYAIVLIHPEGTNQILASVSSTETPATNKTTITGDTRVIRSARKPDSTSVISTTPRIAAPPVCEKAAWKRAENNSPTTTAFTPETANCADLCRRSQFQNGAAAAASNKPGRKMQSRQSTAPGIPCRFVRAAKPR